MNIPENKTLLLMYVLMSFGLFGTRLGYLLTFPEESRARGAARQRRATLRTRRADCIVGRFLLCSGPASLLAAAILVCRQLAP